MKKTQSWHSRSAAETLACGQRFSRGLLPGTRVGLVGDLGSGKTVFTKGIAKGLGIKNVDKVKSPTFVLFHIYEGKMPIYHFDFYRLDDEPDLEQLGIDDYLYDPTAISVIEWADRVPEVLRHLDKRIEFGIQGQSRRSIVVKGENGRP